MRAGNVLPTTVELANAAGFRTDPVLPFFLERYAAAYRAELDAFVQPRVGAGTAPMPNGEDGLRALAAGRRRHQSPRAPAARFGRRERMTAMRIGLVTDEPCRICRSISCCATAAELRIADAGIRLRQLVRRAASRARRCCWDQRGGAGRVHRPRCAAHGLADQRTELLGQSAASGRTRRRAPRGHQQDDPAWPACSAYRRVVMMSGCPGGPGDANANWVTTAWPPEAARVLEWQWPSR